MSSIIPEDIKTIEEARKWLHKRGWSLVLAEEELAKWEPPVVVEDIDEVIEAEIDAEELAWDDEDDDEDEDWDDDDDDEDDWDDDEDDEDK